jgi:hypothetical protein
MNVQDSKSRTTWATLYAAAVRTLRHTFPGSVIQPQDEKQEENLILRRLRELQLHDNAGTGPEKDQAASDRCTKAALKQLEEIFVGSRTRKARDREVDTEAVYEQIGRLKVVQNTLASLEAEKKQKNDKASLVVGRLSRYLDGTQLILSSYRKRLQGLVRKLDSELTAEASRSKPGLERESVQRVPSSKVKRGRPRS